MNLCSFGCYRKKIQNASTTVFDVYKRTYSQLEMREELCNTGYLWSALNNGHIKACTPDSHYCQKCFWHMILLHSHMCPPWFLYPWLDFHHEKTWGMSWYMIQVQLAVNPCSSVKPAYHYCSDCAVSLSRTEHTFRMLQYSQRCCWMFVSSGLFC